MTGGICPGRKEYTLWKVSRVCVRLFSMGNVQAVYVDGLIVSRESGILEGYAQVGIYFMGNVIVKGVCRWSYI